MIHLHLWLRPPEGAPRRNGELIVAEPDTRHGGQLRGEFRYLPEYEWDGAFALDPLHLPLEERIFNADRPYAGVHAVFEDSLPDDWGRKILSRRYHLSPAEQRVPNLLALIGAEALGALAYSHDRRWRAEAKPASLPDLADLVSAAERYETATPHEPADDLMRLFQAASSPGGARPKVLIQADGAGWLVKLPSHRDDIDMVRVEAASLALASAVGLNVPDFSVVMAGNRPL